MPSAQKPTANEILAFNDGEIMSDALYTPRDAAALLGISERTLERRRRDGRPPRMTRLWDTAPPRYRGSDLLDFIERGRQPVSDF